jgi:DNA-directed RNA polymerase specialized sigma24 family protein
MGAWAIATEPHFLAFYDATIGDAHRYASRLVGSDRSPAEDLVQEVYLGLRSAKAGSLTEVGVGWVLVAIRHRFLDGLRGAEREEG